MEAHLNYLSLSESKFDPALFIMIMASKDQDKDLEKRLKRVTLMLLLSI